MPAPLHIISQLLSPADNFLDGHGAIRVEGFGGQIAAEDNVIGHQSRVFPELARTAQAENHGMKAIGKGLDYEVNQFSAIVKGQVAAGIVERFL